MNFNMNLEDVYERRVFDTTAAVNLDENYNINNNNQIIVQTAEGEEDGADRLMEMVLSPINISAQKNSGSSTSSSFSSSLNLNSTTTTTTFNGNMTTTTRTTRLFFPPILSLSSPSASNRQTFLSQHRNSIYMNKININRKRKEQKGFMSALSLYDPVKSNNKQDTNENENNQTISGFAYKKTMPSIISSFESLDLATSYYNVNSTIKTTSTATLDPFSNSAIFTLTTTTTSTNTSPIIKSSSTTTTTTTTTEDQHKDFLEDFENMSLSQTKKKPTRLRFSSSSHSHPPPLIKVPLKRLSPIKHINLRNSGRIHEI